MQLAQLSYAWKLDVDDVDETVDISYHFIPHEPPNRGSIDISTDKTVRKKKCVRQDKKQQNTLFAVDLDDLERKGKAERLQRLHKCKIDQNDTTERWKDVQDIQRRKRIQRIPREEIPTEIHREHTRRHGMDITNDTWPFSLHQPPPHCTTRRIVVVSSSYRRHCSYSFLFIPVSNLIFFHHLFTTSLYHISLPHLFTTSFTTASFVHPAFVPASSVSASSVPASSVLSSSV